MKLSQTVCYVNSLIAPTGYVFKPVEDNEIEYSKIMCEKPEVKLGGKVLRWTEQNFQMAKDIPCEVYQEWFLEAGLLIENKDV